MNFKSKIIKYLKNFIIAQLIVTLVLIPILVYWGLEYSIMSFVGNLIFAPFLMIFLMLSSLVFFTQIMNIPNQCLIFLLNQTTSFWDKLLNLNNKNWLIGFAKTPVWPLFLIIIIAFIFLKNRKINNYSKQIVVLTFGITMIICYLQFYPTQHSNLEFDKNLLIKTNNNKIVLIDNGFFNKSKNIEKKIEFELKPFLIQKLGTSKIENLKLQTASFKIFEGAIQCSKILNLKKVTLPFFETKLDKKGWKFFFLLKNFLKENNIIFSRSN